MNWAARHIVVLDLGFGDAGKGATVQWLADNLPLHGVVRFNGGAQAAHHVVLPDGRHHCFAQFGSGTFSGVPTYLSRFMMLEPLALVNEAASLARLGVPRPFDLLHLDRAGLLTTPLHAAANRARELARGAGRHGSCGVGIGETRAYAIAYPQAAPLVGDLEHPRVLAGKLAALGDYLQGQLGPLELPDTKALVRFYRQFSRLVRIADQQPLIEMLQGGRAVFEGAQGVLLDESFGFHPHTTWTDTTGGNARTLLAEAGQGDEMYKLGVLRSYTVRHGPGPMPSEDRGLLAGLPELHNTPGRWQGDFRVGHFDGVAHRYALAVVGGVDGLALTHLDRVSSGTRLVQGYVMDGRPVRNLPVSPRPDLGCQAELARQLGRVRAVLGPPMVRQTVRMVQDALGVRVVLEGYGPAVDQRWLVDSQGSAPALAA